MVKSNGLTSTGRISFWRYAKIGMVALLQENPWDRLFTARSSGDDAVLVNEESDSGFAVIFRERFVIW